jgi:Kelch motif
MYSSRVKSRLVITALSAVLTLSSCGSSPTPQPVSSPSAPSPSAPPPPTAESSVVVTPATATVFRGQSQQFVAEVSGVSDQTVTWQATTGAGTIDSAGLYTAPSDGASAGYLVTITAISKVSPSVLGSALVTLPSGVLTIAPDTVVVRPGVAQAFTATVVGLADNRVTWTVQGAGGGTITSDGLYTAPLATGVYSVAATSSANEDYSTTAVVVVATTPSPFSPTGQPVLSRSFHTATLMSDGRVLVAGSVELEDYNCYAGMNSAEVYDPVLGSFALTSSMKNRRYAHTSTLLPNGKVLIAGGFSFDEPDCEAGTSPAVKSAELYDSSSGSFAPTGDMSLARGAHTATLLATGKVLIVGGANTGGEPLPFAGNGSATAEVYDPATETFIPTGNMSTARIGQTATLLLNGKVLIAGGMTSTSAFDGQPLATAELYDPSTGAFAAVGPMTTSRAGHTATLLPNGTVLITGGFTYSPQTGTNSAEIYDPAKASFQATNRPMALGRRFHTATLLPNGTVLIVGGGSVVAEIYNPSDGSFSATAVDDFNRMGHTATLLKNGRAVIIGGLGYGTGPLTTAELY